MVLYKKSRVYIALNRIVLHSINSEISPFSAFGKQRGCLKYAVVNPAVSNNLYFALSFDFQVHLHLLQKKKYFDFFFSAGSDSPSPERTSDDTGHNPSMYS